MPRTLSSDMLRDMNAHETGEAILVLIRIDHEDLPSPLLITSDAVDTISNGDTYVSYPFQLVIPDEPEDGRSPRASVQVANVDREILASLRSIGGAPRFDLSIIRGSAPDVIEARWPGFRLIEATYDSLYVKGDLSLDDILQMEYPADNYYPIWFPALF